MTPSRPTRPAGRGHLRLAHRPPAEPLHGDPGLQPERTVLSWGRTLMSLVIVAALFLRWVPLHGAWAAVPMLLAAVVGLVVQLRQRLRYTRGGRAIAQESAAASVTDIAILTGALLLMCGAGLLVVLLDLG